MTLTIETKTRRIATYERVSSQDQRDRETILTQRQELDRKISADPNLNLVCRYSDDGFSGIKPLAERPDGARLLKDAQRGLFNEVWVYKVDRLARDEIDALIIRRDFLHIGIKLVSVCEDIEGDLNYGIRAILAGEERRVFLARSAAGMNRAAREGRYTGGIVSLGYKVVGHKQTAHLEPSESIMWSNLTEADVVRRIYNHLALDGWSCVRIAKEFNELGIPTDYVYDNREVAEKGQRKKHTQGVWRPGHIRNLVVNQIYKGILQYGKRSNKPGGREIIVVKAPALALVSEEVWDAAQETLRRNRTIGPATGRIYLLKSVIRCGTCGLSYVSCLNRNSVWYRCNGHLTGRGPIEGRCSGKDIKGDYLEPQVWSDIETFLRDPGEIINELTQERDSDSSVAIQEAERITLEGALQRLASRRKNAIDLRTRGRITDEEIDELLTKIEKEKLEIEERLLSFEPKNEEAQPKPVNEDLLIELRKRLENGLTPQQRQEIARFLVKRITIYTEGTGKERKARAVIEYCFTPPSAAVPTGTGRGSLPPPA
ncbi:recombinase family protein [Chloroflexota bacterium]